MRRPIQSPPVLTVRLRRALGQLRRSPAFERASGFAGRHARVAAQRLQGRFVRGVWLETGEYLAADPHHGSVVHHAFPAGRFRIAEPTYARDVPAEAAGHAFNVAFPATGTVRLRSPWVLGLEGAVLGADRRLLWDLSYEWPGLAHRHPAYTAAMPRATSLPGTTVTLAAMGAAKNYFHFLCNSVARLAYLPPGDKEAPDRFLVGGSVTPFVAETFALFGIPREQLVGTADVPASRPERLLAPSLVHPPFVVPPHVCDFLHDRILGGQCSVSAPKHRLFIDRSDAPRRRIQNLADLRPVLAEFGLEVVQLAGRSVADQARLFSEAELIVANHGAALANLVFCAPGTRVLQVLAPGMTEREYRTISQHRRLAHDYLSAEFATSADAGQPRKDRDLVLAPAHLRRVLAAEFSRGSAPRLSA